MDYGYDKERFVNLQTDNFDCSICTMVARDPKDCSNCGNVFCSVCIDDWMKKKNECPNRCKNEAKIGPIQRALKKIYSELKINCTFCSKVFSVSEIDKHEKLCNLPKCENYEFCGNILGQDKPLVESKVCDSACLLVSKLRAAQTQEQFYQQLKLFVKETQMLQPAQQIQGSQGGVPVQQQQGQAGQIIKWDKARAGTGIQVADNDTALFLREQAYMFRTALADTGFMNGIHYWEIVADDRTENELKIGVSQKRDFNYNTAFCDFEYGWAYYGLGQLRHNSNATGASFGKRFKKEGVLGCYLNMNKGTLSFSLNGELMGVAYNDPKLKVGPLYPAVSLLHCAGCKLVSGKQAPQIFQNC